MHAPYGSSIATRDGSPPPPINVQVPLHMVRLRNTRWSPNLTWYRDYTLLVPAECTAPLVTSSKLAGSRWRTIVLVTVPVKLNR